MLGLGFPGGPALERLAAEGDAEAFVLPVPGQRGARRGGRARGLRTHTRLLLRGSQDGAAGSVCASSPGRSARRGARISPPPTRRRSSRGSRCGWSRRSSDRSGPSRARRRRRRERGAARGGWRGWASRLHVPPRELCTDNAAMIAGAALHMDPVPYPDYLSLDAYRRRRSCRRREHCHRLHPRRLSSLRRRARRSQGPAGAASFELCELDIRADEALHRAYFERVPVVALDGEELCEFVVDEPLAARQARAGDARG